MTKTPKCERCDTKKDVLVLRNGAMICRPCRNDLRKYFAQETGKPVCKKRAKPRKGPMRDPAYRRWCREQMCVIYGVGRGYENFHCVSPHHPTDPAHTANNGMRSKGPDSSCAPLCRKHHTEYDADRAGFERKYSVDMPKIAAEHFARFQAERERAA